MNEEDDMRRIESLMVTDVVAFSKDAKVLEVIRKMVNDQISCVVVSDDRKPVGILTERDIIERLILRKRNIEDTHMHDIMTHPVMTIKKEDEIVPVGELMKDRHVRRFPVVDDNGEMIGLVTETDVLEGFIKLAKHLDWQLIKTKISVEEYIEQLKRAKII